MTLFDDMTWVGEDEYTYSCESCGYQGDMCDYDKILQEYDEDGNGIGPGVYVELCPECGRMF